MGWLSLAAGAVWSADLLAWPLRLGLCLLFTAVVARGAARPVWHRGSQALRAIEVSGEGFILHLGGQRLPATSGRCQRLAPRLWILEFDTATGRVRALVDPTRQDPAALRGFIRRLGLPAGLLGRLPAGS